MIRLAAAALIAASLFLPACRKQQEAPVQERWAVLLFDDLSADTSHRWLRRGIPEQLGRQLRHPPRLVTIVSQPDPQANRASAIAGGATHVVRGNFNARGSNLQIHLQLEDLQSNTMRHFDRMASGDPVVVIAGLARDVDSAALPSPVKSAAALQAFAEALDATAPDAALAGFRKAIELDPDFGAASLAFAGVAANSGKAPEAVDLLRQTSARASLQDAVDRTQAVAELAALTGDRTALAAAMEKQAQALGSDSQAWARAGEAWIRAGRPDQAAKAYTQALALAPSNADLLNQLGYARAYQGDVKGAAEALDRYRKLRPGDPNAIDSLGDIHYFNNQYAEAARIYREAFRMKPDFFNGISLLKAAYATLWTGDLDAAGRIFEEYRKDRERRNDPAVPIAHAEWLFLSGKRTEAVQLLDNMGAQWMEKKQGALASRAYSLAAVWSLSIGDAAKAQNQARQARAASGGSNVETLSLFITLPPAPPAEWITRAQRMFPPNAPAAAVAPVLATALLFGGHFQAAIPYLDQWQAQSAGQPGDFAPLLKAWALLNTGRIDEARPLVRFTPLIPATGLPPIANLVFPRIFFLRARIAEKEGRQEDARKFDQLFLKLSGDRAKIFGEEAVARKKIGSKPGHQASASSP